MIARPRVIASTLLTCLSSVVTSNNLSAQTPRIRDSVGIRIVENSARLTAPVVFTLGAKPNVDIGGLDDDPDKELSARNGYPRAIRLVDGRVAVADVARVQFFDRSGKRLRITGRAGGGPGEFGNVASLCGIQGDTVFVTDEVNRRVSVLSPTGEFISLIALPVGQRAERDFCLTDGSILANQSMPGERGAERTLRLNRVSRAGAVANLIGDVNTGIFDMAVRRESQYITWGQNAVFGNAVNFEVQVFSSNGKLTTIIRTADKPVPISQSDLEKLPPTTMRANSSPTEARDAARATIAASTTKTWPAFNRLYTDLSGRLWMQDWTATPNALEPVGWTAFDASGKMIGRLIIPAPDSKERRQFVVSFGKDEVFIQKLDNDGAIHYVAYPLTQKK